MPVVIGLTGSFGAGCSTIVRQLESERQFKRFSLSSIPRAAAKTEGCSSLDDPLSSDHRRLLQDIGDRLRLEKGSAYFAEECTKQIRGIQEVPGNSITHFVVDSIRHPEEVSAFRAAFPGFYLMAVYAPFQIRWDRVKKAYGSNQADFEEQDDRDKGDDLPSHRHSVGACVDKADILINNTEQFDTPSKAECFCSKVEGYIKLIDGTGGRVPNWNEVFMGQAYASSLRSSCSKRRVGAAIVRVGLGNADRGTNGQPSSCELGTGIDTFLVSTGFNEAPSRAESCEKRGGEGYCEKDIGMVKAARAMKFCPECSAPLAIPKDASTSYLCPGCRARVIKDYMAGRQLDLCRALHAEEMAILQAARLGSTSVAGTVLYTTTFPCLLCAKKISHVGVEKVVFAEPYPMKEAETFLKEAGIAMERFEGVTARSYFRLFQQ